MDIETKYALAFSVLWVIFHLVVGQPWEHWEDKRINFLTFTFGPLAVYWTIWFLKQKLSD